MRQLLSLVPAVLLSLGVARAVPVYEVVNGPHEGFEQAVSLALSAEQAQALAGQTLVELGPSGGPGAAVPWALDASGATPVLAWVMPGITAAGAPRRFSLVPGTPGPALAGDLRLTQTDQAITVSTSYFEVTHPRRGGGGFPRQVQFRVSGNGDPELHYLDRLFRRDGPPEGTGQFMAEADPEATATVVFESPVRVVVEARTRYVRDGRPAPGTPRVVYRYVYMPFCPVIEVTAEAERDDDTPWAEQHFLHLSRQAYRYTSLLGAEPPLDHVMQAPGTKSSALSASQWAVLSTETDAAGVGGGPVLCWDASDEFVYYIVRSRGTWEGRRASFAGSLYFGPAAADRAWFERWLGPARSPVVRPLAGAEAGSQLAEVPPEGAFDLRNEAMALTFADSAGGFACTGLRSLLGPGARFVHPRERSPGLWRLSFRTPYQAVPAGSVGKPFEECTLDNRSPGHLAASQAEGPEGRRLTFEWKALDLPDEAGAVDVKATVLLQSGRGESEWRLEVANRSGRFGLWEATFPLLSAVCLPGTADVLHPRGNWGGTLVRQGRAGTSVPYPSAACPVQCMAFNLGPNGLYLGAHDDAARSKRLVISPEQDASFVTLAENAGTPGACVAMPFPVVVSVYEGDWWQAAKRYRQWATQQTWARKGWIADRQDVPARMKDIGLWWLGGGEAAATQAMMERAGTACPLPIGLHWYTWHQIPFDHSYPEYFPTKEGFAEAVRSLTARGQVIMPYINGRLWDRDIPSFEHGIAGACKQPSGEVYIEEYGSGRKLAPMCPATSLWQDKVAEICHRLIDECGVNAIYLDQIGAAAPVPCFDPSHGHPLGGGRHWVDGYRVLLDRVKAEAARQSVGLTTENTAEPYMDNIDAYLAWNPRYETDVPLLPAIYSGYTIYFTSPQDGIDSLDAFVMAQGRDFLWGCQLGWNNDWLLSPEHQAKLAFELELGRMRLAGKDFMVFGELLDEVRPQSPQPVLTTVWNRTSRHTASLPAVQGTLWRARDGRLAVFLVNYGDRPGAITYEVTPGAWGAVSSAGWLVQRLTAQGTAPWQRVEGATIRREEVLDGHEVRGLVIAPFDREAVRTARRVAAGTAPALAACAREFLFAEALARAGLSVSLPPSLQTVVLGEPLALEVSATAARRGAETLTLTWPDGATETLTARNGTTAHARRLVWAGDGAAAMESIFLGLRAGGVAMEHRVRAAYQAGLEVRTGCPAAARGGESFVMPATVTNHSRVARVARLVLECPTDWQVEPAASLDLGRLGPGEARSTLLHVRVPPADRDHRVSLAVRVVEPTPGHEVLVLTSRPVAVARQLERAPSLDGRFDEWTGEPAFRLGGAVAGSVRVDKGYGGAADCSAEVRLGWDATALYVAIAVTDNVQSQSQTGFTLWQGDCVQLAFRDGPPATTTGYEGTEHEVGLSLGPQGPEVFQWMPGACPCPEARLAVVREGPVTRYEAALPWTVLGARPMQPGRRLAWSMTVNDNDGEGFRGWLEWTPGVCGAKDASAFGWFEAGGP